MELATGAVGYPEGGKVRVRLGNIYVDVTPSTARGFAMLMIQEAEKAGVIPPDDGDYFVA